MSDIKKSYLINPWRQTSHGDAIVTLDQIEYVERIFADDSIIWLEVVLKDGRKITTETRDHQNVDMLFQELADDGAPLK